MARESIVDTPARASRGVRTRLAWGTCALVVGVLATGAALSVARLASPAILGLPGRALGVMVAVVLSGGLGVLGGVLLRRFKD